MENGRFDELIFEPEVQSQIGIFRIKGIKKLYFQNLLAKDVIKSINVTAGTLKFGDGYVKLNYDECGTSDTEIGVTNYSNGQVLEGYIRNLTVYSPK